MSRIPSSKTLTGLLAGRYCRWFCATFVVLYALSGGLLGREDPSPTGDPRRKLAYYIEHREDFDLVFAGDSRTYTGMQPELIDPVLGTRSFNLGAFAHWFPTQYPFFQDLVREVPPGTTVVWSLGHVNFFPVHKTVNNQYPIGLANAPRYAAWGYRWSQIYPNLRYFSPMAGFLGSEGAIRGELDRIWRRTVRTGADPGAGKMTSDTVSPSTAALLESRRRDPLTGAARLLWDHGRVTSLEVEKLNGSYLRVEIDGEFFREKREEMRRAKLREDPPGEGGIEPDPAYWNLFLSALDLFTEAGVNLVVSEFEEAPQMYPRPGERERWRDFMRRRVQPEVERRGHVYVRVDFDLLAAADYFDHNHLNSRGVEKFTLLFTAAVAPHLPKRRQAHALQLR